MKKLIIIGVLVLFAILPQQVNAQNYYSAVGLRAGYPFGITYKARTNDIPAFEVILGGRGYSGFEAIGLLEFTTNPTMYNNFGLYFGAGIHAGFYGRDNIYFEANNDFGMGVDGIIGIEWTFDEAPVNISLDWKPGVNFVGPGAFLFADGAISVRYVLD